MAFTEGHYRCTIASIPQENKMKISDFIAESKGKFITINFIKKDGTPRKLNGRIGVTKYLKNGTATVDLDKYLIVYDTSMLDIVASTKTPSCR
jgi:hypothetical protein